MGTLKVSQNGVSIAVEWPYGALGQDNFSRCLTAIERIYGAVGDPAVELLANAITYDAEGVG